VALTALGHEGARGGPEAALRRGLDLNLRAWLGGVPGDIPAGITNSLKVRRMVDSA